MDIMQCMVAPKQTTVRENINISTKPTCIASTMEPLFMITGHPRTGESNSRLNSEYQRYGVLLGTSTSHRVADHSIEFGPHQQGSHQASRVYTGVIGKIDK